MAALSFEEHFSAGAPHLPCRLEPLGASNQLDNRQFSEHLPCEVDNWSSHFPVRGNGVTPECS